MMLYPTKILLVYIIYNVKSDVDTIYVVILARFQTQLNNLIMYIYQSK